MMEKADTIEDMIRVEQRLTEVQTELDSYESTLKGLDNQVEYARVDISLKEVKKYRVRPEAGFGQKAKSKLQEGFENFVDGVTDLLFGLLNEFVHISGNRLPIEACQSIHDRGAASVCDPSH